MSAAARTWTTISAVALSAHGARTCSGSPSQNRSLRTMRRPRGRKAGGRRAKASARLPRNSKLGSSHSAGRPAAAVELRAAFARQPDAMREAGVGRRRREERRQPGCGARLARVFEGHGARAVEHDVQVRRHFLVVELDDQGVRAGVGVPVDVPQVVSGLVIAMLLELERAAGAGALVETGRAGRQRARRPQHIAGPGSFTVQQGCTQGVRHVGLTAALGGTPTPSFAGAGTLGKGVGVTYTRVLHAHAVTETFVILTFGVGVPPKPRAQLVSGRSAPCASSRAAPRSGPTARC